MAVPIEKERMKMIAHKAVEMIDFTMDWLGSHDFNKREDAQKYLIGLRNGLTKSVKFFFGQANFPRNFKASYTPLPFDLCYYEMQYSDDKALIGVVLKQETKDSIIGDVFQRNEAGFEPQYIRIRIRNVPELGMEISCMQPTSIELYNRDELDKKMWTIAKSVIGLTQIMACSNIEYVEHPEPIKLNKKRNKQKKQPLFSYKTLQISNLNKISSKSTHGESDRNSPRLHLRRGHIRRYQTGKTTWVNSCVVGNKKEGVIKKDYEVITE